MKHTEQVMQAWVTFLICWPAEILGQTYRTCLFNFYSVTRQQSKPRFPTINTNRGETILLIICIFRFNKF